MATKVRLSWSWIDWEPGDTWKKKIIPQLDKASIAVDNLQRCVYVIRANGVFAIQYPSGVSPVLYIGEGNFEQRLNTHKAWLGDLADLVSDYSFLVGIAIPRVNNNSEAYKDCEAALLQEFRELYSSAPLVNSHMEKRRNDYVYSKRSLREALQIGKGVKYMWAITPMPASGLHEVYEKTHAAKVNIHRMQERSL